MSIRKKPLQAVPLLLDRLDKAKELVLQQGLTTEDDNEIQSNLSSKFDDFKTELENMSSVFPGIKKLEKKMMDQFCDVERELDSYIFKDPKMKSEVNDKLDLMMAGIRDLGKSVHGGITFKSSDTEDEDDHHQTVCPERLDHVKENNFIESYDAIMSIFESHHYVNWKMCSLCLSVFPMKCIIEKKPLIYWWMGEGLVKKNSDFTAEEVGEQVFQELVNKGLVKPNRKDDKSMSVKNFFIDPWIHQMLILIAKENLFCDFSPQGTPCNGKRRAFLCQENDAGSRISGETEAGDHVMMVFNVDKKYLRMKPEWLSKLRKVEVLQMGRWQNSVAHHIEVKDQTLFNALGSQKHLRYLSLRGISRIETLPASISNLISLQILDLRACHNLEKLPPTISRLKNLTHLDVSHCYLLESMPKGIQHLAALQVVKGFVIGKADKNSCKISDLARLRNLRKLSIRVGETMQDNQLGSLHTLTALRILTISWGEISSAQSGEDITLPEKLTKLDLRCVPFESVPAWLSPSNLPSDLDKLYIKGGKLESLENMDGEVWNVRLLRFKYIDHSLFFKWELEKYYRYLDEFDCYELF